MIRLANPYADPNITRALEEADVIDKKTLNFPVAALNTITTITLGDGTGTLEIAFGARKLDDPGVMSGFMQLLSDFFPRAALITFDTATFNIEIFGDATPRTYLNTPQRSYVPRKILKDQVEPGLWFVEAREIYDGVLTLTIASDPDGDVSAASSNAGAATVTDVTDATLPLFGSYTPKERDFSQSSTYAPVEQEFNMPSGASIKTGPGWYWVPGRDLYANDGAPTQTYFAQ